LVAEAVTAERERIAAWLDDRADVILRHHGGLYYEPIQTLRTAAKDVRSGVSHGSGDETVNDD
jgi:hypothetical protein